jgi:3-oxoacyl-[acyl-carrier-protein] synthase-1
VTVEAIHWGGPWGAAPVIAATSAINALAFTAHQTWAFRRAEATALVESPFLCENGFRATMALVRTLPPRAMGAERLAILAGQTLEPMMEDIVRLTPAEEVPVLVCLAERLGGDTREAATARRTIEDAIAQAFRVHHRAASITTHARGHASLGFALRKAGELLTTARPDAVVIGGVDGYYDPDVVDDLVDEGRLFDGENLDSFIPGEGAAFLVLTRPHVARRLNGPLARVEAIGTQYEPAHWGTGLPSIGLGLSRALRPISDRLASERRTADLWLADVTNENHRVHEWSLAYPRACAGVTGEGTELQFLPSLLGDLGAATMPTGAVVAVEAFLRGDPGASTCVLTGSSDAGDRAAVLLARATEK